MAREMAAKSVLLIDDDPMSRDLLALLLEHEGYEVRAVESGEAALKLLGERPAPDVVLSDLQMPGLSGAELGLALRVACAGASMLIAMSASTPPAGILSSYDSFLLKPFRAAQVGEAVANNTKVAARKRPARTTKSAAAASKFPGKSSPRRALKAARARTPTSTEVVPKVNAACEAQPAPASVRAANSQHPANGTMQTQVLSPPLTTPVLNQTIYRQLAKSVPAMQLLEMYTLCVNDARRRIASMRRLAVAGDAVSFVREAHSIKGGGGFLGASQVQAIAGEIERRGLDLLARAEEVNSLDELAAACDRLERMLATGV